MFIADFPSYNAVRDYIKLEWFYVDITYRDIFLFIRRNSL